MMRRVGGALSAPLSATVVVVVGTVFDRARARITARIPTLLLASSALYSLADVGRLTS